MSTTHVPHAGAVSRRAFLGVALVAGAAVTGLAGATNAGASALPVADPFRLAVFGPLVGQTLTVVGGGALRVLAVRDNSDGATGEAFTVVLEPHGLDTTSSLFTVRHPALGTVALAATVTGTRGRLHAVIDRRASPSSRPAARVLEI